MKHLFYILLCLLFLTNCKDDADDIPILTPNANFTYTVSPANYKTINFLNASKSIHTQSKYLWYFGDGDSSVQENPVHEFKADGYYNVVLRVTNKELMDSYTTQIRISNLIPDTNLATPQLSFVFSQKGREFTFQNTTTGPGTGISYFWNFGDKTEFSAADENGNKSYTYTKDGSYNVVLKALYNNTIYSISRSIYVSENYNPLTDQQVPVTSFVYRFTNDSTVTFINTSSMVNGDTKYEWYFDKNNTSTEENPYPVTFKKGIYTIVLKASNGNYTVASSREIEIPKIDKPVALFVYSQNGLLAKFVNASSNVNAQTKYQWVFGDGEYSTDESPEHIYDVANSGKKFTVILKVVNNTKSDVFTSEINIP